MHKSSRLPGFYRLSMEERVARIADTYDLTVEEVESLRSRGALTLEQADQMIENAVGIFSLPIGVAVNFLIDGKDYLIPMAIEEASVVAGAGHAAKIVREGGGFATETPPSLMIGQIQVVDSPDQEAARTAILEAREDLLDLANRQHPNMLRRGGGAKDLEVRLFPGQPGRPLTRMVVVHLLVDTSDAMGANAINTMVEAVAPEVERLSGGKICLRILSNLADRCLVRSRCTIPPRLLGNPDYTGEEVIEGILQAQAFAEVDPYRATTHNKGIMNGIDAVVIATGNDWRSIEAGAHAYAARNGRYEPLTRWYKNPNGNLAGSIELPLAVGIVGGAIQLHPMAQIALKFLGVKSAQELRAVIASVGLAQNLAALKALATEGIQRGHMSLHARSVAVTAGATGPLVDRVVDVLIQENNIKVERACQVLEELLLSDRQRFPGSQKVEGADYHRSPSESQWR